MIEPYCGPAPLPSELIGRWNLDPALVAALVACGTLHVVGVARDRSDQSAVRKLFAAAAVWTLLILLFVSPLCALTSALFSARVVHHVALVAVVAPLVVLSLLRPAGSLAVNGAAAFVVHTVLLWVWHAPAPYAAALADPRLFWVMELSLLGSAVAMWLAVLSPAVRIGATLALLLGSMMQMGLLGAVITFARAPLYAAHFGVTAPWGLSALQDQQLAGLIMWVPGSLPYLAAALALLASRLDRLAPAEPVR